MNTSSDSLDKAGDWVESASRIHDSILRVACANTVRVGFVAQTAPKEALQILRKAGFRKPLFAKTKNWVRHVVVNHREAFLALAWNIQLEFVIDGRPKYWRATGTQIDWELAAKMVELGHGEWFSGFAEPLRILLCFNLGFNFGAFQELVELDTPAPR